MTARLEMLLAIVERQASDTLGTANVSVASVAREAKLSRQSLYASYPSVIERIRNARPQRSRVSNSGPEKLLAIRKRLTAESAKVRLLSSLLVEALAELASTKEVMEEEIGLLKRRLEASSIGATRKKRP